VIKFEASTLERAMEDATKKFECSITELQIEVIQHPKSGMLGVFKKPAIIVAMRKSGATQEATAEKKTHQTSGKTQVTKKHENFTETKREKQPRSDESAQIKAKKPKSQKPQSQKPHSKSTQKRRFESVSEDQGFISTSSNIITPTSLVTAQDDYEEMYEEDEYIQTQEYTKAKPAKDDVRRNIAKTEAEEETIKRVTNENFDDKVVDDFFQSSLSFEEKIEAIKRDINHLFNQTCFDIDPIAVSKYDADTVLVEYTGNDAALLIGKEGYRYKALSYMLFNWINAKYDLQLRLEIAEFLRNQEEMIRNYLVGVCAQVDKDGRAQTKILDGVLVQIALKELRTHYPDKYVAIRTNRDGLKYVIINSFRSNNG